MENIKLHNGVKNNTDLNDRNSNFVTIRKSYEFNVRIQQTVCISIFMYIVCMADNFSYVAKKTKLYIFFLDFL